MNRTSIKEATMTTTDGYHTRMVAPEQSPHASELPVDCVQSASSAPSGEVYSKSMLRRVSLQHGEAIPVTEQEEEAWLVKMQQLAGCVA
jgi:hypothetical protein